jgi:hypothetical protein
MTDSPTIAKLAGWVSAPRLTKYVASGLDPVELYRWNSQLAAAVFEIIGHAEVLLRNAIHNQLTAKSAPLLWFDDPFYRFNAKTRQDIAAAKSKATVRGVVDPSKVVTELTLGFWRFMLSNTYSATVWPRVSPVFAGIVRSQRDLRVIAPAVTGINDTRNRIAHQRPVFHLPTVSLEADIITLASWIGPDGAGWIRSVSRVGAVLADKPTK